MVDHFGDRDELALDERALFASWAWEQIELSAVVAGVLHTELQPDPPGVRRTVVPTSPAAKAAAAARLGAAIVEMLDPELDVRPTPAWSHCSRCWFRAPCLAWQAGDDREARALLSRSYRPRPPDVLEEGRLGGVSWSVGRGAAPPRFGPA